MNEAPRRPLLDRAFVVEFRRRRVAEAFAEVCSEKGYRDVTVADIVARAATSRNAFYAMFANKEEAFEDMLELASADLFARIEAGCERGGEEPFGRVEGALGATLGWVAERPHEARACLVEAASATPATLDRQQEAITRISEMLRETAPCTVPRPRALEEYLVGGVHSVLANLVLEGEERRAPELVPDLSAVLLGPYLADRRR